MVAATSGEVVIVETTSTSFITGAGLKKCMPMTSPGREVAAAHSTTGSDDVVVARMAPGLQISSRAANTARLTSSSSAIGLDHEIDVGEVLQARGAGDAAQRLVALAPR